MSKHTCNKEAELATMAADIKYIVEKIDGMSESVKKNTQFRQQAKGIVGGVSLLCTILGSGIFFVANKIMGGQ